MFLGGVGIKLRDAEPSKLWKQINKSKCIFFIFLVLLQCSSICLFVCFPEILKIQDKRLTHLNISNGIIRSCPCHQIMCQCSELASIAPTICFDINLHAILLSLLPCQTPYMANETQVILLREKSRSCFTGKEKKNKKK